MLLALAHRYYVRLASSERRAEYRDLVRRTWRDAVGVRTGLELKDSEFVDVLKAEQTEYLRRMAIPGAWRSTARCRERLRAARMYPQPDARVPRREARLLSRSRCS